MEPVGDPGAKVMEAERRLPPGPVRARSALIRAAAVLSEAPEPEHGPVARSLGLPALPDRAAHTAVMLMECHPYAGVHLGPEGMLGGEAADRVAGFWRATGYSPPPEPDHLAGLLGLYASFLERESREVDPARRALLSQARTTLLWEHILTWVPAFAIAVAGASMAFGPTGRFYLEWSSLLLDLLEEEASLLPEQGSPLPVALRAAPGMPEVSQGDGALLDSLVAPIRCGMVLTRADLARCAKESSVGLRAGERRFILEWMMSQDRDATLGWLSKEATRWAAHHKELERSFGSLSQFWRKRALSAAERLDAAI